MTYFHRFFRTIDGVLGDLSLFLDIFEFFRSQSYRDLSLISRAQCVGEWRGQLVLARVPEEETCGSLLKNLPPLQHLNFQFISSFYISSSAWLIIVIFDSIQTHLIGCMMKRFSTLGESKWFSKTLRVFMNVSHCSGPRCSICSPWRSISGPSSSSRVFSASRRKLARDCLPWSCRWAHFQFEAWRWQQNTFWGQNVGEAGESWWWWWE